MGKHSCRWDEGGDLSFRRRRYWRRLLPIPYLGLRLPRLFRRQFAYMLAGSIGLGAVASLFTEQEAETSQSAPAQSYTETSAPVANKVKFRRCAGGSRVNCIVDGDTLWSNGVKIRVADIDAPEISKPRCAAEKALGERATVRLMQLVNAGPFQMHSWPGRDEDKYGRKLRVLVRDGRSLGDILVSEGLVRTWTGRREPWC